ncbi:acyl-CoA dehydrogenase [Gordonia hirsuta DSM 44140 = NBRC 16056]|uniref:Acyl-CoA dehydrogenase n=1 Tax=Gordonia hirsuta DSM 44140 = NBRC 16056 TaxID=1121927 RepID=L7LDZ2_9ACTN|nr:acyl-CoA dehydrogenase family protein [Gordonia hirsuta]GAC58287.1 acyl-CoA dehydrogenase [Gordonia hirsuta DSM 44140 = NBRC 16056]
MTDSASTDLPLIESDDDRQIREAVRRICASFGDDYARRCHDEDRPPTELWQALGDAGFIGLNLAEEWGGGGMGMRGLTLVAEETAAAGTALVMLVVSSAITGSVISAHGTPEQKQRWLPGIADGSSTIAFAITESDAGSNSHNLRTSLQRDGDGYRLSGQKVFISGVESAESVLVVARFREEDGELGVPCLCIVDVDAPGFTRTPIPMPFIGADKQWQLFFDNVEISADRLIGGERGGLRAVFDGLNPERIIIAGIENGIARRALDKAAAYARERTVWKTPIGAHQAVAHRLAKARIELELSRLMTSKAAVLCDAGAPGVGEASNIAKYSSAEAAIHSVDASIQTHGGNGFALEYGISDMWWMARLMRTAPVSADMVLNFVSEHMLGLPKSY